MSKQAETKSGLKSASAVISASNLRVERWTALSNDVWSTHEMHLRSNTATGLSNPRVRCNQSHTTTTGVRSEMAIASVRIQASQTSQNGNRRVARSKMVISPIEDLSPFSLYHHSTSTQTDAEMSMRKRKVERSTFTMMGMILWRIYRRTRGPGV